MGTDRSAINRIKLQKFGSDVSPLLSTPGTQGTAIAIPDYSTYIRLTWYIYTYQIDAEMCSRDENKHWPQPVRNGPYHDRNDTRPTLQSHPVEVKTVKQGSGVTNSSF
eukprot:scaffold383_cov131-Skeletonema_marinoi.AAC.6